MLEHVNHPFICNLRYSFQDIEYMSVVHPIPYFDPKCLVGGTDTARAGTSLST